MILHKVGCTSFQNPTMIERTSGPASVDTLIDYPHRNRFPFLFLPLFIYQSFKMDSLIVALAIFALNAPYTSPELHKDNIQMWADLISEDLAQLAKQGLEYEEIQNIYDKAQYTTDYINGTSKVLEVREKLGM